MKCFLWLNVLFFSARLAFGQAVQVDPTFDPGAGPNPAGEVNDIQVLPDGRILVGGAFTTWNGETHRGLVRLNSDGSLDQTFNSGVDANVNRIFWQDSILWVQSNDRLFRLLDNGAVDTAVPPFQINGMAIAAGDNIYRVYVAQRPRPVVELYSADGTFQRQLLIGTVGDHAYVMEALPGGGMLLGGALSFPGTQNLEVFTPSGVNSNFMANAPRGVRQMAVGPDVIYVAADNAGSSVLELARVNGSGQLDTNFVAQRAVVSAMAVAADGRLVFGNHAVTRLDLDGSIDTSFKPEFNSPASINTLAAQPDGRTLVGGSFKRVDGLPRNNIARLLAEAAPLPSDAQTNPPTTGGGNPPPGAGPGGGSQPPGNSPTAGFTVSGFVTDGTNGIAGVRVRLRRQVAITDASGAYEFTGVRAGRYVLHASARGFLIRPFLKRVHVVGDVSDVDFVARERTRRHGR